MSCNVILPCLLDFSNGEASPLHSWIIRRHLAACADCQRELASLKHFKAALRRVDVVPTDVALTGRTSTFAPSHRLPLRRALALGVAALLAGCLLLLPTLNVARRNAQNPSAAVAAALGRVNTWHFAGWKQIDGKQIPWEVWGRRKPFLYYERVGDIVTWDDGKQRLRVFPPNAALNRPSGLIIKNAAATPATPDAGFQADPAYQCLAYTVSSVNGTGFGDGFTQLYQQTPEVARFRRQNDQGMSGINENKLYTISKRDWLPVTYQLHFQNPKLSRDTEYLHVDYDGDLPNALLTPPAPLGYSVVDFTQPTKVPLDQSSSFAESHGFRVQATCAGMDKEGNLLIVMRGWLGGNPLSPGSTFSLNVEPSNGTSTALRWGQRIPYLYGSNSSVPPGVAIYLPYTPLEPAQVVGDLPETFLLSVSAAPTILVRSSDRLDANGAVIPANSTENLYTAAFRWKLPLPPRPVPSLLALLPPDQRQYFQATWAVSSRTSAQFPSQMFEFSLADQRRSYYFLGYDYLYNGLKIAAPRLARAGALNPDGSLGKRQPDGSIFVDTVADAKVEAVRKRHPEIFKKAEQAFRARAAYWQQRKLDLLPRTGSTHETRDFLFERRLDEMSLLAEYDQMAGDTAGRNRTLRQLIHECGSLPQEAGNVRQAEYALRTGLFPGDVGYKGPS